MHENVCHALPEKQKDKPFLSYHLKYGQRIEDFFGKAFFSRMFLFSKWDTCVGGMTSSSGNVVMVYQYTVTSAANRS